MTERIDNSRRTLPSRKRDMIVAGACGAFVACMVGMSYAAVPFYDWFCRSTGFNGTTQIAAQASNTMLDRKIVVRFDANISNGLPWRFEPERNTIEVKLGEVVTINYLVINQSARETIGVAAYNIAPLKFGAYFQKINCFCFTEQKLKPGEKRELPVVFFVDTALAQDADAADLSTITLSYTFYPQREPQRAVAETRVGQPGTSNP